jgi:hypothetical protein
MRESVLVSFAILNVKWDERGSSYIDNFVPFVADCLGRTEDQVVSDVELRQCLIDEYGITLPHPAVKSIVGRAARLGLVERQDGVFRANREKVAELDLTSQRQSVRRQYEALVSKFISYADAEGMSLGNEQAEEAILTFIERRGLPMLKMVVRGEEYQPSLLEEVPNEYLVSGFVTNAYERDPDAFGFIETVVKGTMLATAMYLPDSGAGTRDMSDLTIYLDTRTLLSVLGWDGPAGAEAARELTSVLRAMGARLACFGHTAEEMRNVLQTCVSNLQTARRTRERSYTMPIVEYCLQEGIGPSEVDRRIESLERDLDRNGVKVLDAPDYRIETTLDETKLEDLLQESVGYRRESTRLYDVKSVAAIHNLRDGKRYPKLESARAIFATSNAGLVRAARIHFGERANDKFVPTCTLDHELATVVWLRNPVASPDLPRKQLLADAYAAMLPDDDLWTRFLDEVDRLEESDQITEQDYFVLRFSVEARRALMRETRGEDTVFTSGTVAEVLRRAHQEQQRELHAQLRERGADLDAALSEKAQAEAALRDRDQQRIAEEQRSRERDVRRRRQLDADRQATADRVGKVAGWAIFGLILALAALSGLAALPDGGPLNTPRFVKLPAGLLSLLVVVWLGLGLTSLASGFTVASMRGRIEKGVSNWVLRALPTLPDHDDSQ